MLPKWWWHVASAAARPSTNSLIDEFTPPAIANRYDCLMFSIKIFTRRQKITTSTTEAELLALNHTTKTCGGNVSFQAAKLTQKKQATSDGLILCDNKQTVQGLQKISACLQDTVKARWYTKPLVVIGGATTPYPRLLPTSSCWAQSSLSRPPNQLSNDSPHVICLTTPDHHEREGYTVTLQTGNYSGWTD